MSVTSTKFSEAYNRLNGPQQQAVDAIDGPVMVIAGPGTGKTQVLTLRIANILLKTDTPPESVLALTFTNAGAHAMRARLRSFIGTTAQKVSIYTFHGFAEKLIKKFPEAYPKIIGGQAVTDVETFTIIEELLSDPVFTVLRPAGRPDYYVRDIISALGDLKKEGFGPDAFASFVSEQEVALTNIERVHQKGAHKGKVRGEYLEAEKKVSRNKELLLIYRRYEAALRSAQLYDYNDMVFLTVRALTENEEMRLRVQEEYQYILADEHQDVNGSQNRILEIIASYHDNPNVFVVGDEKQAIYRFQGASLENFLHFQTLYPRAAVISLVDNYRSSQAILDIAQKLVETEDSDLAALRVPLVAATDEEALISYTEFAHQAIEDAWLVSEVKKYLEKGVPATEIAVIVRKNRQVEYYTTLLRGQGIAVAPSADSDMLTHPLTRSVLLLLEAVAKPTDEVVLAQLLHEAYWDFAPGDLLRVLKARTYAVPLAVILAEPELSVPTLVDAGKVGAVRTILEEARTRALTEAPQRVLAYLLSASGLLATVMASDPQEGGRVVRRIYDEVEASVERDQSLSVLGVVQLFRQRMAHGLPLTAPLIAEAGNAVPVMTAHKSKGLEFSVVLLPDASDVVWDGGGRSNTFVLPVGIGTVLPKSLVAEDDIRLFYVALTRAKRTLLFSTAVTGGDGRLRGPSAGLQVLGLLPGAVEALEPASALPETPTHLLGLEPARTVPVTTAMLRDSLLTYGLSATSLNNYLKSPWNYLYRNVLRIPEPKAFSLQYGTALHAVIDACVHERSLSGKFPAVNEMMSLLSHSLGNMPLSVEEFTRMHERGLNTLAAYIPQIPVASRQETEVSLSATLLTGIEDFPEVTLTGKLDRLDFESDGRVSLVTDYKTGKPRTRGQIEGSTKDSEGEYKRQLVFYALLLSLQDDSRYYCRDMCLSFVEPTAKGEIKEEQFTITTDEMAELRSDIIRVVAEIASGTCLQAVCDPERSDYCDLVAKLGPQIV